MRKTYDHIIIGAGIVGLSIAFKLKQKYPKNSILILEKESSVGAHASGRNSGVLHSGIYYKSGSLKAKLCANGAKEMAEFCHEHHLPINPLGKVIVGDDASHDVIKELHHRATSNGAVTEIIYGHRLREIEPELNPQLSIALYSPNTAVVDPYSILSKLTELLTSQTVDIKFSEPLKHVNVENSIVTTKINKYSYGNFYNTAGLYADKIAHTCNTGIEYTILPFKGIYFYLKPGSDLICNGLIYPAPDLRYPFLGIHVTKSIQNKISIGPSAVPSLGRENYSGLKGISVKDATTIFSSIANAYAQNLGDFRNLVNNEAKHFTKRNIVHEAQKLIPKISSNLISEERKIGIRAQLYNKVERKLEMDFIVRENKNTIHVLNAVSPGFTSAFSFSDYIVNQI